MADMPLRWYAGVGAKYLDLVGDYAGKENFFIEGDSLLLECFNSPGLDFDPGFQLLHAAYLVEKYLHNLLKRGCTFDIVFFEDNSQLCVPPNSKFDYKYLLARSTIIKHLQTQASNTNVFVFDNPDDAKFLQYLHHSACYFALCSDGAAYTHSKQSSMQRRDHAVEEEEGGDRIDDSKLGMRTTIFKLMIERGLDVALLSGLAWQDSKIFAFVLERNGKSKAIVSPANLNHSHQNGQSPDKVGKLSETEPFMTPSALQTLGLPTSSRMTITLSTLSSMGSKDYARFVVPHLVHILFLEGLPLTARALPAATFPQPFEKELEAYEDAFTRHASTHVRNISLEADQTIIDLIDGRLLRLILQNPSAAWKQLSKELKTAISSVASKLVSTSEPSKDSVGKVEKLSPGRSDLDADDAVLPFSHPAFDQHLRSIQIHVDPKKRATTGKLALELTHWHNSSMLVQPKGRPPKKDPKEEKRAARAHQRFLGQLTGYAASLTDGTGKSLEPKTVHVDQGSRYKAPTAQATKAKGGHAGQANQSKKAKPESNKTRNSKSTNQASSNASKPGQSEDKLTSDELMRCLAKDGPHMERSMDAQEDDRVPFKPDGWQVKVLDEIDEGNSLLVSAPTSAGKTFISFYAMEKVLRASDDAVLVYVAPTKALVNQIAAEVLGKFKKQYKYPGTTVYSIFTRDYRVYNPTKCQILVTVPHLLQIMLMSPTNKDWVPKIKTIIFDEVHSVSQAEDGLIWEQLLMTSPCQIIALSATIGNTTEFSEWLSSAQAATGRNFSLVQHDTRYSELRKYLYEPDKSQPDLSKGLPVALSTASETLGLEHVPSLNLIHPVGCLVHPQRGIPPDLSLESGDCLVLWHAMDKHQTKSHPLPTELTPTRFFGTKMPVKADVLRWGAKLKDLLTIWMQERDTSPYQKVIDDMYRNLQAPDADSQNDDDSAEATMGDATPKQLLESTLPLLCDLKLNDALPAILFNYNRSMCEDIASYLFDQLVEAEDKWKEGSASWKTKMEKYNQWVKEAPAREKAMKSGNQKSKTKGGAEDKDENRDAGGSKADRSQSAYAARDPFFDSFDPSAPLDQFSFANIKKSDKQLLDEAIRRFTWVGVPDRLIQAFRRGICVHHAGMNRWYRQAAEMFFRRGFLTVVVATGTLSLGINMPCKTVVFSGDSAFLTALNFRQASGRAGRRGFDLLGNVIFQNLPTEKALRLMSSKLPDINGHFPMTTVFVLRLLSLLHGTNNAKYAMDMTNALLSKPRLFAGGEEFKQQVLHHVRFSIEYLRSQGLLNAQGHPIGFASCVSHLYFVENSALAFHALLQEGYFHDLAEGLAADEESTLRKLMLIMSNLFARRPMRAAESDEHKKVIKDSVSLVILPDMPKDAARILQDANEQTLRTYRTYVSTYVEQHCKEPDNTLPFTRTKVMPNANSKQTLNLPDSFPAPKMRSPFAALSGLNDDFTSISDLCDTVRGGVFLEKAVIPYLEMGDELTTPLNAYLYDFYNHGSVKALLEANRVPRGDLWFVLKDFSLVIATIVTAMENVLNPKADGDMDLANDGEEEKDDSDEATLAEAESVDGLGAGLKGLDVGDGGSSDITRVGTPEPSDAGMGANQTWRTKKKKVADSWDDEESSDEEGQAEERRLDAASELAQKKAGEKAEKELKKVYALFKMLQERFETKFMKMWA